MLIQGTNGGIEGDFRRQMLELAHLYRQSEQRL